MKEFSPLGRERFPIVQIVPKLLEAEVGAGREMWLDASIPTRWHHVWVRRDRRKSGYA